MKQDAHVIVSQFAIQSDLQFAQIIASAKLLAGNSAKIDSIVCASSIQKTCEYANWLSGLTEGAGEPSQTTKNTICFACKHFATKTLRVMGLNSIEMMPSLATENSIQHELANVDKSVLISFLNEHSVVSDIISSSYATEFKLPSDFSVESLSPNLVQRVFEYAKTALELFLYYKSNFQANNYKSVHLFNGRFMAYRAAMKAAEALNIPTFVYERGPDCKPILVINQSATYQFIELMETFERNLFPFDYFSAFEKKFPSFILRTFGNVHRAFTDFPTKSEVLQIQQAAGKRRIVSVFTTTDFEYLDYQGVSRDLSGLLFRTQREFLQWLRDEIEINQQIYFIIRIHPNEGKRSQSKRVPLSDFAKDIIAMFSNLTDNCIVVHPDNSLSSYSILGLSNLATCYGSSIGLEASQLGIPSVVVGDAFYKNTGAACFPASRESLRNYIKGLEVFTREELLEFGRRAWIVSASNVVFGIWQESALETYDYSKGLWPKYNRRRLTENCYEMQPKHLLENGYISRLGGKSKVVLPPQPSWDRPISIEPDSEQARRAATHCSMFLSWFWSGKSGFPLPPGSPHVEVWLSSAETEEFVPPPLDARRHSKAQVRLILLRSFASDYIKFPESRPFIEAFVLLRWTRARNKYMGAL